MLGKRAVSRNPFFSAFATTAVQRLGNRRCSKAKIRLFILFFSVFLISTLGDFVTTSLVFFFFLNISFTASFYQCCVCVSSQDRLFIAITGLRLRIYATGDSFVRSVELYYIATIQFIKCLQYIPIPPIHIKCWSHVQVIYLYRHLINKFILVNKNILDML